MKNVTFLAAVWLLMAMIVLRAAAQTATTVPPVGSPKSLAHRTQVAGEDHFFVSASYYYFPDILNVVTEYTSDGQFVRRIYFPNNHANVPIPASEILRGISVTDDGKMDGFNGTFQPELSVFDARTRTFTTRMASNWKIPNALYRGSAASYQGYTFVLNESSLPGDPPPAIIRFNPDGSTQSAVAATNYVNLTMGLDGLLYTFYIVPNGSWRVDAFDPITLQRQRTINLQVPGYHPNMEQTDLTSIAVDAEGGIYAIDIGNYVYHLDKDGTLLQSASHGYGEYADDIKIDPSSGRILISLSGVNARVLQTDASLSSFQTLFEFGFDQSENHFLAFSNAKLAEALLPQSYLLWTHTSGMASVWNLSEPNPAATYKLFGPYAGWAPQQIAQGPDGHPRLLWTNTSGQAALWNLADADPPTTTLLYGPFPGWTATALAVGPDNAAHLLWDNTDGRVALWNTTDAQPQNTCLIYGPFTGWAGVSIGIGSNNQERLLWDNTTGQVAVWNLSDASPSAAALLYGPYPGWTAKRLSVGNDNAAHLLWDNVSGQVALWNLSDANPVATALLAGPYGGWTGQDLSVGADNKGQLLWDNTSGQTSLWNLADANPTTTSMQYGPFQGWTAVSIAAGQ